MDLSYKRISNRALAKVGLLPNSSLSDKVSEENSDEDNQKDSHSVPV